MKTSKVLVISTSLRGESNSHELAKAFAQGATDAGNEVELITLHHKDIRFCIGCLNCQQTGKCVFDDDVPEIMSRLHDADVVCFATPIYYYEMSGLMKTLLDRFNPLFGGDYRFTDVYLMTSAAEDMPQVPERAVAGLGGWIECFERARYAGGVFAGGVTAPGSVKGHPALAEAYEMGKNV